ncbi:MAG: glycosyltransferase [archaeon]|jgi:glycosyltransferase involved in cell wall biosynthesis|nr:glycosyltransferase [archaeon]
MKLSIVMPAYNEERRIGPTLSAFSSHFEKIRKEGKLDYAIIVVINKSTDKTEEIVKKLAKKNKRISYVHLQEKGKGLAVREGFKLALKNNSDFIGFVDADLATTPEEYARLASHLYSSMIHDGVIACRYRKGAIVSPRPTFQRYLASRGFNLWLRALFLFPYRDTQCGAKIFKRRAIESIIHNLTITKWAFDVDLLYHLKKANFKVKEVPTCWSDKEYSKINFLEAGPLFALATIRLRLIHSPFRGIIKLYDALPSWLKPFHKK